MGTMRGDLLSKLKEVGRPVEDQEKIIEYAHDALARCCILKSSRAGYCLKLVHQRAKILFGPILIVNISTSFLSCKALVRLIFLGLKVNPYFATFQLMMIDVFSTRNHSYASRGRIIPGRSDTTRVYSK
jgi:hypothetical protein